MAIMERNQRVKDRILDSAESLFRRLSFAGFRMKVLSDHLGISRKTLYNHFPGGKRDIWKKCIERHMEDFSQRLFALTGDHRRDFVERARDILDIGREGMRLFYGPEGLIRNGADADLFVPEIKEGYARALMAFLREGTELGYVRPGLPYRTLASVLTTLIAEWGKTGSLLVGGEVENLADFVEQVLFDGILSDEGRRNVYRLHGEESHE